jgi:hypothetical protein
MSGRDKDYLVFMMSPSIQYALLTDPLRDVSHTGTGCEHGQNQRTKINLANKKFAMAHKTRQRHNVLIPRVIRSIFLIAMNPMFYGKLP